MKSRKRHIVLRRKAGCHEALATFVRQHRSLLRCGLSPLARGARMEQNSRRFRGIFGVAVTWGIALSALATSSLALGLAFGLVPTSVFGARELVALAVRGLFAGGLAGALFGYLLANRERESTLATMSMRRIALWGFLGAASIPVILSLASVGPPLPIGVLVAGTLGFGGIGGLLGTATLRIARRDSARLNAAEQGPSRLMP